MISKGRKTLWMVGTLIALEVAILFKQHTGIGLISGVLWVGRHAAAYVGPVVLLLFLAMVSLTVFALKRARRQDSSSRWWSKVAEDNIEEVVFIGFCATFLSLQLSMAAVDPRQDRIALAADILRSYSHAFGATIVGLICWRVLHRIRRLTEPMEQHNETSNPDHRTATLSHDGTHVGDDPDHWRRSAELNGDCFHPPADRSGGG